MFGRTLVMAQEVLAPPTQQAHSLSLVVAEVVLVTMVVAVEVEQVVMSPTPQKH
jgi:hypothetical protein